MTHRAGFAALAALFVVIACTESGARPTTVVQAADTADQLMVGFSHYVTDSGVRRSRVDADTAYFYEGTQLTLLRNIRIVFYDAQGAESSTLTAREGSYPWRAGTMEARGGVRVVASDGRVLRSERLRYDPAADEISTDQPFSFDRRGEHLEGTGFRSDPDFRNVVVNRPRGVAGGGGVLLPGQEP